MIFTVGSPKEIFQILLSFNNSFPRPLSERIGNLSVYAVKLAKNATFKILLIEQKTIGFVVYYCNDFETKEAFLTQLAIAEGEKEEGHGSFLLNDCFCDCLNKKMQAIRCEVDNENKIAIEFYKKKGFVFLSDASESSQYLIKKL